MKVLVMSEETMRKLSHENYVRGLAYGSLDVDEAELSMTEVEVPDGCVLAVVDPKDWQVGKGRDCFDSVHGDFTSGFTIDPRYCRVVREVKL